jgi:hypothetical protein
MGLKTQHEGEIKRLNMIKMQIPLKTIYKFSPTPIKILLTFFVEIEKPTLNILNGISKDPNN